MAFARRLAKPVSCLLEIGGQATTFSQLPLQNATRREMKMAIALSRPECPSPPPRLDSCERGEEVIGWYYVNIAERPALAIITVILDKLRALNERYPIPFTILTWCGLNSGIFWISSQHYVSHLFNNTIHAVNLVNISLTRPNKVCPF